MARSADDAPAGNCPTRPPLRIFQPAVRFCSVPSLRPSSIWRPASPVSVRITARCRTCRHGHWPASPALLTSILQIHAADNGQLAFRAAETRTSTAPWPPHTASSSSRPVSRCFCLPQRARGALRSQVQRSGWPAPCAAKAFPRAPAHTLGRRTTAPSEQPDRPAGSVMHCWEHSRKASRCRFELMYRLQRLAAVPRYCITSVAHSNLSCVPVHQCRLLLHLLQLRTRTDTNQTAPVQTARSARQAGICVSAPRCRNRRAQNASKACDHGVPSHLLTSACCSASKSSKYFSRTSPRTKTPTKPWHVLLLRAAATVE